MNFLVLSDLHIESAPFFPAPGLDYDAVILAGDIMPRAEKLPLWASRDSQFGPEVPIVVVPGNHEYYGSVMQTSRAAMQGSKVATVHVLDPGEVFLAEGRIRVLGCTLWTDFQLPFPLSSSGSLERKGRAMSAAKRSMMDYELIRFEEPGGLRRELTPADTLALHEAERAWLLAKLREPFAGQTVVVTHHAPSAESVAPKYADDWCTPAFVSQLPDEFFETAALWVHGHTHTSFDYVRGRTRVICNPRGYRLQDSSFENSKFDPRLVVSVDVGHEKAELASVQEGLTSGSAAEDTSKGLGSTPSHRTQMESIRPKVGNARVIETREDAYRLLEALGATARLLRHLALVGEAADALIAELTGCGLKFDADLVRLGAAVHDAGKIIHPSELHEPGSLHEPTGETLLLAHGVQPAVARCCVTHAAWQGPNVSFEERVVALADKLWKGKREEALELVVIDDVAAALQLTRWDVFTQLDEAFERIASAGPDRLERSLP